MCGGGRGREAVSSKKFMLNFTRFTGLVASVGTFSLYIVLVFFNPYSPGDLTAPIIAMMLVTIIGGIVAVFAQPYLMLACFGVSFIPIGFYMLGTPGIFRWIGIFNLLYLVASGLMIVAKRKTKTSQG